MSWPKGGFDLTNLDHFQNMLNKMDYQLPGANVALQYWLFCGDRWLQWKAATDINELDTRFTVGQTMGSGKYSFTC